MNSVSRKNFANLLRQKGGFLAQVYMLLAAQLAITAVTAVVLRQHQKTEEKIQRYWFIWFILSILLIIAIASSQALPIWVRFAMLTAFSVLLGLMSIAASKAVSPESIKVAIVATAALFVALSIFGGILLGFGIDLSFMQFALSVALIALLIIFIVMIFIKVPRKVYKAVLVLSIVLFSIYIAFDTNVILQKGFDDPVLAATSLFLDAINIFTDVVAYENS